jgi:hypothetical protein
MAKLQIATEFLAEQLFGKCVNGDGMPLSILIKGAIYDQQRDVIELEITGPDVPDAERVVALITRRATAITFKGV